jgi:AraC-like DNA-binding protein
VETELAYEFLINTSSVVYRGLDAEYDFFLAILIDACRLSLGEEFSPQRVCLQHPPPSCRDRFARYFFGCQPEFDASNFLLSFDKAALDQPLPTGNAEVARANDQVILRYLAELNRSDLVMRVKVALIEGLPSGQVSKEQVSESLGVSLRTLQRRLHDEGTGFKQLLDETRRELADGYIKNLRFLSARSPTSWGFPRPATSAGPSSAGPAIPPPNSDAAARLPNSREPVEQPSRSR